MDSSALGHVSDGQSSRAALGEQIECGSEHRSTDVSTATTGPAADFLGAHAQDPSAKVLR